MKTFVVIDDSHDFIEALRVLWQEIEKPRHSEWEAQFLCCRQLNSQQNIDNIAKDVAGKDHILLDGSLVGENLLAHIVEKAPTAKLWMFTGWQREYEIENWETWRKGNPQLQAEWFDKPLDLEQVLATLAAATQTATPSTPSLSWEQWPLPCRLFDANLTAIATNPHWRIAVDAFPNIFSKEDRATLDAGKPIILDTWCEQPDSPRHYGQACFHTFRLGQNY